jgi:hypothetical protein
VLSCPALQCLSWGHRESCFQIFAPINHHNSSFSFNPQPYVHNFSTATRCRDSLLSRRDSLLSLHLTCIVLMPTSMRTTSRDRTDKNALLYPHTTLEAVSTSGTRTVRDHLLDTIMTITALLLLRMTRPAAPKEMPTVLPAVGSPSDTMPRLPSLRARAILGDLHHHLIVEAMDRRKAITSGPATTPAVNRVNAVLLSEVDIPIVEGAAPGWLRIASFYGVTALPHLS